MVVTGLSLPAAILTLAGGAIFGLGLGTVLVSFASTAGATLAFLLACAPCSVIWSTALRGQLAPIQQGIRQDGALYLLSLRLAPVFPFFLINILMGHETAALRYALVSQVGMLPGTIAYVNAGPSWPPSPAAGRASCRRRCWAHWPCWRCSPGSSSCCWRWAPTWSCTCPGSGLTTAT